MRAQHTVSWWRVTRNIFSLFMRELLNKGTYLILGIGIARVMGREAFGDYTLSLLLSRSFFTLGDLGFGTWLVREVSKSRERAGRYFGTVGVYRLISGVLVVFLLGGFLFLSRYEVSLRRHVLLSAVAFFFLHLTSFVFSFFRAFEKMENEFKTGIVKNILFLGGGLWAISRYSLDFFYVLFILSSAVAFLVSVVLYWRHIGWKGLRWEPMPLEGLFSIWMIQGIVMLYLYVDTVLLSFFRGLSEVGLYQAAYSFLEVIFVLSTVLATSLFPVFARLSKLSPHELPSFYEETFRAVLFFCVPFGVLSLFGAKTLLGIFYGPSFQGALPALYILLSGFVFFIVGGLNSHLLVAMGSEKVVLGILVGSTLFNGALNLWAIPRFGFLGASATTLVSEIVMFSLMVFWIAKTLGDVSFLQGGPFMGVVCLWVLFLLGLGRFSFWIQLPVGLGVYVLFVALFHRQLSKELCAVKILWKEFQEGIRPSTQAF